jgi:predicted 3-demethylubiquinone-9 3-methyltransferase (glyoxalase superfamily)
MTAEGLPMTASGFTTCLWFDTQAEEAAEWYLSIFPGSKRGGTARYTGAGPGPAGSVMTVEFELGGQKFLALNGGPQYTFSPAISFQIMCDSQEEVDYYWDRLTDGGQEVACGWVTDKFGISWQVVPRVLPELMSDPDQEKAQRVAAAMLKMVKLDIGTLQQAYSGG